MSRFDLEGQTALVTGGTGALGLAPADLSGAAVFLGTRASDYVHGVVLPVDGGWMGR